MCFLFFFLLLHFAKSGCKQAYSRDLRVESTSKNSFKDVLISRLDDSYVEVALLNVVC